MLSTPAADEAVEEAMLSGRYCRSFQELRSPPRPTPPAPKIWDFSGKSSAAARAHRARLRGTAPRGGSAPLPSQRCPPGARPAGGGGGPAQVEARRPAERAPGWPPCPEQARSAGRRSGLPAVAGRRGPTWEGGERRGLEGARESKSCFLRAAEKSSMKHLHYNQTISFVSGYLVT